MRIYFAGLGGVGIGPLAEIALDAGYDVVGSDLKKSLMSTELEHRGVQVHLGEQTGEFLQNEHAKSPFDWFVYTAALPEDHSELVTAHNLGIPTAKRDEFLAHVIQQKDLKLLAISGTHGKTTTTGMMVWTFKTLGIPVSYSIGTTISFGSSGAYDPASEYFVYECDEFDRNMLHFQPYLSVITSLDYDHPDTYPTKADYTSAFSQFLKQSQHTIGWKADLENLDDASTWQLEDNEVAKIALPGEHNRRNATLVQKAFEYLQLGDATNALNDFPGTNRRFEKLGDNLYSDYGHHPVEIAATLQMARELSEHVVLVYQPHQNIRQHEIREDYTDCMRLADEVYWLPTYLSRENPNLAVLTPEQLAENLANKDSVHFAELNVGLWTEMQRHRDVGNLVLCMGAGSIDEWVRSMLIKDSTIR